MSEIINFMHIPKNAGTSIQKICISHPNKIKYNGHRVDAYNKNIKNQLVVVQNPISRFESAVRYALQKCGHEPHVKYLIDNKIDTANKWITIWRNKNNPEHANLMKEMQNVSHRIGNKLLEYRWTYSPQINYINDPKYVILMENLDQELGQVLQTVGIDVKIPENNVTKKTIKIKLVKTIYYG
jgi:hypothetical protein